MPRPSLPNLVLLLPVTACAEASVPAPASAKAPSSIEVRLSPEDRAWLAELIAADREPAAVEPAAQPTARSEPRRRSDVGLRDPDDVPDKLRLVTDGPLTSARYNTGSALFEGQQVQIDEEWVRDGAWRAWHPDGKSWEEGAYRAGEEDGPWRWWYENGNPQALGSFADGQHVGGWTFYHETGYVLAEGVYEDDRPVGVWRTYHDSGALHSEGRFEQGKREGRWVVYDPSGMLDAAASGLYRAGERVGE